MASLMHVICTVTDLFRRHCSHPLPTRNLKMGARGTHAKYMSDRTSCKYSSDWISVLPISDWTFSTPSFNGTCPFPFLVRQMSKIRIRLCSCLHCSLRIII